jgi:hypothetical protein
MPMTIFHPDGDLVLPDAVWMPDRSGDHRGVAPAHGLTVATGPSMI